MTEESWFEEGLKWATDPKRQLPTFEDITIAPTIGGATSAAVNYFWSTYAFSIGSRKKKVLAGREFVEGAITGWKMTR